MSNITLEELQAKMLHWSTVLPVACKKALTEAALLVQSEAQRGHLSGPAMPRGVGSETDATLAVRTGRLRRSISNKVTVKPGEVEAIIGTNVEYARVHEFGREWFSIRTKGYGTYARRNEMPKRPFMRPSLEAKHGEAFELLRRRFFDSYSNSGAVVNG